VSVIDQLARDRAQKALEEISAHEQLCIERYDGIKDKIGLVLKVLGFGGGTMMTILLGMAAHSWTASNDQQAYLNAKVDMLLERQQQQAHAPEGSPR
jgi:hypothetical protein